MKIKFIALFALLWADILFGQTSTVTVNTSTWVTQPPVGTLTMQGAANFGIYRGSGTPNGVVTANPGSLYLDIGGGMFVKTTGTGNTGWVAPGSGSIGGSTGATDNAILRADGTGGATLQNSGVSITDTNNITGFERLLGSGSGNFIAWGDTGFGDILGTGQAVVGYNSGQSVKFRDNAGGVFFSFDNTNGLVLSKNLSVTAPNTITGNGSVPTGGTTGQVLAKNSNTNYDVAWTTGGGGGAPTGAGYITKTADGTLTNEFALGTLATGILKNTTSTGVPTIAVAGTDYGMGSVTNFSAGDLSPLFTTTEATTTTTPALSFTLSTAAANTVFGNNTGSTAAPAFQALVDAQVPNTLTLTAASNLTTNGFVKTSGGTGTLSIDTNTYLTSASIPWGGSETGVGNTNYTILSTDKIVVTNASFSAARTWTLPLASAVTAGYAITVMDKQGTVTTTNTLTVQRAGSDLIYPPNSGSYIMSNLYQGVTFVSDGSSKWYAVSVQPGGSSGQFAQQSWTGGVWAASLYSLPTLIGTTGKMLQSNGSNVVFSASTWPTSNTSAGKIIRGNGTNFLESTATFPDTAGTSGNVLTSDGTNWTSAAPTGGGAPTGAGYITKTADGTLSNEFALGSLATGLLKNTTTTGVPTIAVAKTDYWDTSDFVASGGSHAKGLVPDPGATGGTTKFLREDATWQVPPGGGGGSPGGSNSELQYNNSGAFGGIPELTYTGSLVIQKAGSGYSLRDPTDTTKRISIDASGITTGNTRTFVMRDADGSTVPAGGSSGQVLKKNSTTNYDYSWAADSTGAGGSPGGSDTQIQYNDGGAFGGDAGLTWDETNKIVTISGSVPVLELNNTAGTGSNAGLAFKDSGSRIWAVVNDVLSDGTNQIGFYKDGSNQTIVAIDQYGIYASANSGALIGWGTGQYKLAYDTAFGRNAAGVVEINNGTSGQWAALKLGTRDSATNTISDGLIVGHNSTGTPAGNLGSGILFNIHDSAAVDSSAGRLAVAWTTVTSASKSAYMDFQLADAGAAPGTKMRAYGSGALSVGGIPADPGAGYVNANTGYKVGGTDVTSATQTLTNKRITPRVVAQASSATWSPNGDTTDVFTITTAQATNVTTINAPSGTPTDGQRLIFRIKCDGTARTLAGWNAIYRFSSDMTAPTTLVASKTFYLGFTYNSTDSTWDNLAQVNNF